MNRPASILPALKLENGVVLSCQSPVCDKPMEAGGIDVSPKRFCSPECRHDAWVLRRAAKILGALPIARQMGLLMELQKGRQ